jgi:hypothetical protein
MVGLGVQEGAIFIVVASESLGVFWYTYRTHQDVVLSIQESGPTILVQRFDIVLSRGDRRLLTNFLGRFCIETSTILLKTETSLVVLKGRLHQISLESSIFEKF